MTREFPPGYILAVRKIPAQAKRSSKARGPHSANGRRGGSRPSDFLTIGCLYPMTSRGARYGHDSMIAAEMAAEELNAGGGRSFPFEALGGIASRGRGTRSNCHGAGGRSW